MPYDVQSHRPDVLIIQFGMNDCNIWETDLGHQRVSPDAFVANLCEMFDRGRLCGVKEVLLGVNHPSGRTTTNLPHAAVTYDQSNRQYDTLTRSVARTKNIELVDMERSVDAAVRDGAAVGDFLLDDQLHLSVKGHDLYFEEFCPVVARAVRKALER